MGKDQFTVVKNFNGFSNNRVLFQQVVNQPFFLISSSHRQSYKFFLPLWLKLCHNLATHLSDVPIRKEFLSRTNYIYYWRLFCMTQSVYLWICSSCHVSICLSVCPPVHSHTRMSVYLSVHCIVSTSINLYTIWTKLCPKCVCFVFHQNIISQSVELLKK